MDETPFNSALGMQLAMRRRALRLSQQQVADTIGIHRPSYTLIESGNRNVTALEIVRLCRALRLDVGLVLEASARADKAIPPYNGEAFLEE